MALLKKLYRRIRPERRAFILVYHRIRDLPIDPWEMAVTPANFERQVQALAKGAGAAINGAVFRGRRPLGYITFDDGYADNYEQALPILKKHNVQATVFLATGYIGARHEYWWDRLERIFLLPGSLPEVVEVQAMNDSYHFPLGRDARYSRKDFERHRNWRPWESPPTLRHLLYRTFWSILHRSDPPRQQALIGSLERWADGDPEPRKDYLPMTVENVREMGDNGVDFGAHTVNHVSVHHCSEDMLIQEILGSRRRVAEITSRDTKVFSYPYGETSSAAQTALSRLGFDVACTSRMSRISPRTPPLLTPRFSANNRSLQLIESFLR